MKGVSNVISELLLLVITVFLAAVVYAWTMRLMEALSANPLPPMLQVSGAYLFTVTSDGKEALFVVINVPNRVNLYGVYVYGSNGLICSSSDFILSADDPKAVDYNCDALRVAGYYGSVRGLDPDDARYPGLMLFSSGCQRPAASETNSTLVGVEWFYLNGPDGYADPWATVISAVPETTNVGGGKVETSFNAFNSTLNFERYLGKSKKAFYSSTGWVYVPAFKEVGLRKGTYTVILWCPGANFGDYGSVKISIVTDAYVVSREVSLS